ncbi:metallophosphoesterase [Mucilaginibacter angelicae]|uniref:Metallophosphoesterase n=1 Tax=Mucilaginibacter angelicae TaxID=869718 RepID=A0ABV6KYX5_9SPHI
MITYTNQIQILHLSDIHFGAHHICNPPHDGASAGFPKLADLISEDLQSDFDGLISPKENTDSPLIIAASGDFTQRAEHNEFVEAGNFLVKLTDQPLLGKKVARKNIYTIPGNHDVTFAASSHEERFQPYINFYNKFYENIRPTAASHHAEKLTQIHIDNLNGNKIFIVEINCSMYVQQGTVDSSRGQIDMESIRRLRLELTELAQKPDYNDYIKIAMMHHHVVLLPSFIEAGRGVDSILNAGYLLELLSSNNFHLILHGHKHYPQIFNYEPLPLWSANSTNIPQLVISGGSCGSNELPNWVNTACNTYGLITIKWHPAAKQARVRVITRGLIRIGYGLLAPDQWYWKTLNVSDKILRPYHTIPEVGNLSIEKLSDAEDIERKERYAEQRGKMPVVEVMPSLVPGQAYEVRAWIVSHDNMVLNKEQELASVEWSAGKMFAKIVCNDDDNPKFSISYHYWGPMLIQAKLNFKDGYTTNTFIYARLPKDESR